MTSVFLKQNCTLLTNFSPWATANGRPANGTNELTVHFVAIASYGYGEGGNGGFAWAYNCVQLRTTASSTLRPLRLRLHLPLPILRLQRMHRQLLCVSRGSPSSHHSCLQACCGGCALGGVIGGLGGGTGVLASCTACALSWWRSGHSVCHALGSDWRLAGPGT